MSAIDEEMFRSARERVEEILAHVQADAPEVAMGSFALSQTNGAMTDGYGAFSLLIKLSWCYRKTGFFSTSRPKRPPERYGIEALAIEFEGRDPVILDVPTGTWTEHDGEDGLWATWDLGVVEVAGRP